MPRGDRSKRLTIGLALFAGLVGLALFGWAQRLDTSYQNAAHEKARDYQNAAQIISQARCSKLPSAAIRACVFEAYVSAEQNAHDEYDLQAQLVSAAWTKAMGVAAIIGMAVGILGVGLIYSTFEETRTGNEIARDALIVENRAWLIVDELISRLHYSFEGKDVIVFGELDFRIKNTGKSTATDIWTRQEAGRAAGIWGRIDTMEPEPLYPECIPPSGVTHVIIEIEERVVADAAGLNLMAMTVPISISYSGGGKEPFVTECLYRVSWDEEGKYGWSDRDFRPFAGRSAKLRARAVFRYFRNVS